MVTRGSTMDASLALLMVAPADPAASQDSSRGLAQVAQMSVANAKHTVLNPVIPYTGPIPGGLHTGEIIIVQGTVPPDADRFHIDLSSGCSTKPCSDIALRFNARFEGTPSVTCNSLRQERWDREQTLHQLPYKQGAPFETIILVHEDVFKASDVTHEMWGEGLFAAVRVQRFSVAVNGSHLLEYKHRIPLDKVDTFSISGKVRVNAVGYIPNSVSTTGLLFLNFDISAIYSESGDLVSYLLSEVFCSINIKLSLNIWSFTTNTDFVIFQSLPYKGSILKGLKPGQHITIKGQVSMYPHSFTVNLRSSGTDNIALHLNPRIKSGMFIRNSYLAASWGQEERELPFFPFSPGEYFEILMLCQSHQFKLAVNGCHLLEFRHRVQDLSSIDQLEIMGDLELSDVKLW
ncbi:Galectin-8 [Merluccius polli]|uniref:Galectin n=1 Tax=Merluccius polli TaxID=89951 RepID=A0AA47PD00_MERPO|nr:Galectin-8 [Merluccius polli]